MDVLTSINELRTSAASIQKDNERLKNQLSETTALCEKFRADCRDYQAAQEEVQRERANQIALQNKVELMQLELKLVRENKDDIKSVVLAAFKNPTIKQNSFGSVPVSMTNGGYTNVTSQPTSNMTVIEEE
jgi:predicted RNase H-like nuclease (RuvC/YqgF family)